MVLCGLHELAPGSTVGADVTDPAAPSHLLLRPGVVLDPPIVRSLAARGVTQVWVHDDLTADIDGAVAGQLTQARLHVLSDLKKDLQAASNHTISTASAQNYKQSVMGLITQAIATSQYAGMTDALFQAGGLASHSVNVAYLSLLAALHAENYIVAQQPRLPAKDARDATVVGLAGLLHDIGKCRLSKSFAALHEVHCSDDIPLAPEYVDHVQHGRAQLEHANIAARVTYAVLNHHQRFDGGGWPDMGSLTSGRIKGPLSGHRIHIVARIVAACNVLDNLLKDAAGAQRPPVAALHDFASERFSGWFDPVIRRAVLLRIPPFAVGTQVRLSDGRRAVVSSPSLKDPCRPQVRLLESPKSPTDPKPDPIDLAADRSLTITHALGVDITQYLYDAPIETNWWAAPCDDHSRAA